MPIVRRGDRFRPLLELQDHVFAVRLARYCARNPVALGRLEYRRQNRSVTYHSDKPMGPTAGGETMDALEFLARVVSHIPTKGQVLQRYYGWYAIGNDFGDTSIQFDDEGEFELDDE